MVSRQSMRKTGHWPRSLIERYPDTDGVMCVADPVAYGVLTECQRRKRSVPNDIKIAGFGAYDLAAVEPSAAHNHRPKRL